jgi:hypothetical protein
MLTKEASTTDSGDSPNEALAYIFEWLMDRRKAPALASFSIGATQCYLMFGMLTKPDYYEGIKTRATSWQNLYDFYFARDVKSQFATGMWDYLNTTSSSYPLPGSPVCGSAGTVGCVETYLQQYQTGKRDWTAASNGDYARRFQSAVNQTWYIGNHLEYPGMT